MNLSPKTWALPAALAAAWLATGCISMGGTKSDASSSGSTAAPATAAAPAGPKVGPGMNAAGEVVDVKKVEQGHGQKVKGINDWEGEITGKPAPGTKFTQLKIGMTAKQAMDIVGQPTDQGAYVTGKAWIPFYFGSDRYRYEMAYKGQGRLIFAGSAGFDTNSHLIWIIHAANDTGYR
jgi:hypothetical protein